MGSGGTTQRLHVGAFIAWAVARSHRSLCRMQLRIFSCLHLRCNRSKLFQFLTLCEIMHIFRSNLSKLQHSLLMLRLCNIIRIIWVLAVFFVTCMLRHHCGECLIKKRWMFRCMHLLGFLVFDSPWHHTVLLCVGLSRAHRTWNASLPQIHDLHTDFFPAHRV